MESSHRISLSDPGETWGAIDTIARRRGGGSWMAWSGALSVEHDGAGSSYQQCLMTLCKILDDEGAPAHHHAELVEQKDWWIGAFMPVPGRTSPDRRSAHAGTVHVCSTNFSTLFMKPVDPLAFKSASAGAGKASDLRAICRTNPVHRLPGPETWRMTGSRAIRRVLKS